MRDRFAFKPIMDYSLKLNIFLKLKKKNAMKPFECKTIRNIFLLKKMFLESEYMYNPSLTSADIVQAHGRSNSCILTLLEFQLSGHRRKLHLDLLKLTGSVHVLANAPIKIKLKTATLARIHQPGRSEVGGVTYSPIIHSRLAQSRVFHSRVVTSSHLKSFLQPAVPPIRLFLMINMMPLKRCVVKVNYFTALLRNEARNKFLMSRPWLSVAKLGRCHLLPLDGAVYIFSSNLAMSNFPDKVGSN